MLRATLRQQHTPELGGVPSGQEHNILAQPTAGSVYQRATPVMSFIQALQKNAVGLHLLEGEDVTSRSP